MGFGHRPEREAPRLLGYIRAVPRGGCGRFTHSTWTMKGISTSPTCTTAAPRSSAPRRERIPPPWWGEASPSPWRRTEPRRGSRSRQRSDFGPLAFRVSGFGRRVQKGGEPLLGVHSFLVERNVDHPPCESVKCMATRSAVRVGIRIQTLEASPVGTNRSPLRSRLLSSAFPRRSARRPEPWRRRR